MTTAEQTPPPSLYGEDPDVQCPICIETLPPFDWFGEKKRVYMSCCGNSYCTTCAEDILRQKKKVMGEIDFLKHDLRRNMGKIKNLAIQFKSLSVCPLCRKKTPKTHGELFVNTLRRARSGDRQAMPCLGNLYEHGEGVEPDMSKSTFWYKKSAELGVVWSMYIYGKRLQEGQGCERNQSQTVYWLKKAADLGCPQAIYDLSLFHVFGNGVERNAEEALQLCKESAELGFFKAEADLGYRYMYGNGFARDEGEALRLFRLSAEKGFDVGQYELGLSFDRRGDYEQSVEWLKKSADQDFAPALYKLASVLLGDGTTRREGDINFYPPGNSTLVPAVAYMRRAAALGFPDASSHVEGLEKIYASHCVCCKVMKASCGKLLMCSKCNLLHYCSKECQIKHWKAGHKKDCREEL